MLSLPNRLILSANQILTWQSLLLALHNTCYQRAKEVLVCSDDSQNIEETKHFRICGGSSGSVKHFKYHLHLVFFLFPVERIQSISLWTKSKSGPSGSTQREPTIRLTSSSSSHWIVGWVWSELEGLQHSELQIVYLLNQMPRQYICFTKSDISTCILIIAKIPYETSAYIISKKNSAGWGKTAPPVLA